MKTWVIVLIVLGVLLGGCVVGCTGLFLAALTADYETESELEDSGLPAITARMGENVQVDDLTYKVTRAETFTVMGASLFEKETSGKFVKVYLDITNSGKETQQAFSSRFTLVDSQNRQFDRLSDDSLYISDAVEFGIQLQPSLTSSGAVVFEIPKDSYGLRLVINGDWLSTSEAEVEISDVTNIGRDITLMTK